MKITNYNWSTKVATDVALAAEPHIVVILTDKPPMAGHRLPAPTLATPTLPDGHSDLPRLT